MKPSRAGATPGGPGSGETFRRRCVGTGLGIWLVGVLASTLHPSSSGSDIAGFEPRLLGDAVRNVALFVPLGVGLAWHGHRRLWRALATATSLGVILSVAIETLQTTLGGRDPALSDVMANGLGAALGALIPAGAEARRTGGLRGGWGDLAGVVALCGVVGLALLGLSTGVAGDGAAPVFLHVDHRLEYIAPAPGVVDEIEIAGARRVQGWLTGVAPADLAPHGGSPVRLRYAPQGPAPSELRSILIVSDSRLETALMLGRKGDALVVGHATLAAQWGFGSLRGLWPGRFDVPGRPVSIEVVGDPDGYCVRIASSGDAPNVRERMAAAGDAPKVSERCDLGLGLADAWSLLAASQPLLLAQGLRGVLGMLWSVTLFGVAGFWFGGRRSSLWIGGAAVTACLVLQATADVRAAAAWEWATVYGAYALGALAAAPRSGRGEGPLLSRPRAPGRSAT